MTPVEIFLKRKSLYGCLDKDGNVWEWRQDWCDGGYYEIYPKNNPIGSSLGIFHVERSGCSISAADFCRCAYRGYMKTIIRDGDPGFRLASLINFSISPQNMLIGRLNLGLSKSLFLKIIFREATRYKALLGENCEE